MKVYLAGPMRGLPDDNKPAFHRAAAWLRAQGYEVFNPAEDDTPNNLRLAFYHDTRFICLEAQCVALMPGWQNSRGARAEKALAEALDMPLMHLRGSQLIAPSAKPTPSQAVA